jgi:hypothetical chaperone protein
LIEDRLGFQIFEAIDATKRELSRQSNAVFLFPYPGIDVAEPIARSEFESAASDAIERILSRFEDTLSRAGIAPDQIERLYLTGGTAQVPAVVNALGDRVGAEKLQRMSTFHSVIQGLAERARELASASE